MLDEEEIEQDEPKQDKDPNNEKLEEGLQSCLKDLMDQYEKEDGPFRKQQVKQWKKHDEFWHGMQYVFWSESKQDWISPAQAGNLGVGEEGREDAEGPFYDYVINIYKAHGEAIIAALSAQIPSVRFPPDDADNDDDIMTSKTYAKVADLIQRHNKSKLVLLRALFIIFNQGNVYSYHAPKSDKAFGKISIPKYGKAAFCPQCEKKVGEDEGQPCPECGTQTEGRKVVISAKEANKTRTIIDLFGGLHVKVSRNARNQNETPYLILKLDQNLALLKSIYPHIADEIEADYGDIGQYERASRTPSSASSESTGDENENLRTLRRAWMRPYVIDGLPKEKDEEKKKLKKMFPNGIYCAFVGKVYAESRDEELDKYWTIGQGGLSQYLHSDPVGQSLIPIQELTNILTNVTQETIEQGIAEGYADPEVLDFESYSRHERRPGMTYPATPKPGTKLGDSFAEGPRASLSKEVPGFADRLDKAGQFVVGSFPSIYGGPGEGKSRTASEYNMSRQMALQRLSIVWTLLVHWWAAVIEKSVKIYVENLIEDERFTKQEDGNYVNVWIRKGEMVGKVGEVEAEGAETFPVSTPQKQDLLMKLLGMGNQFLEAAIFDSENRKLVADALAFPEFHIPGEAQRVKQARETQLLLKGMWVAPNPLIDEDEIHTQSLKNFLVDAVGMDAERTNPKGYALCVKHLEAHQQSMEMKAMKAAGGMPPPGGPPGGPQ